MSLTSLICWWLFILGLDGFLEIHSSLDTNLVPVFIPATISRLRKIFLYCISTYNTSVSGDQLTFDNLLINEEEVSESLLTETLIEFIRIGDESGRIVPQESFEDLTNRQKVVVTLLAQHALEGLDMAAEQWLTPTEIAERSGIKKNSVYPAVRKLEEKDVTESDNGSYRIPSHSLETAKQTLDLGDDE